MKTTNIVLLLALSCFLSLGCNEKETPYCNGLKLDNKTSKDVYVIISYDYPDTSLNFQSPRVNPASARIGARTKTEIKARYNYICVDTYFNGRPNDTLSIFVFDAALVDTTPWINIRQNYRIMKRFDVGKDDVLNNSLSLP